MIGGERPLEGSLLVVSLVSQPLLFRAPIDTLVWGPGVLASACKADSLEAHRLQCGVPCQDYQIGPRELAPVFLFDRPEQPACLI